MIFIGRASPRTHSSPFLFCDITLVHTLLATAIIYYPWARATPYSYSGPTPIPLLQSTFLCPHAEPKADTLPLIFHMMCHNLIKG